MPHRNRSGVQMSQKSSAPAAWSNAVPAALSGGASKPPVKSAAPPHESLGNLTPRALYFGRDAPISAER